MAEQLTVILNKLHALESIGFITCKEVGKRIGQRESSVRSWIVERDLSKPDGENAIRLFGFCSEMTLIIAMANMTRLWTDYRAAYERAKKLFPVNSKGEL